MTLNGNCLCGAVTVTADAADVPRLRACHCDMCRRHTSGMFVSIEAQVVQIDGPAQSYRSSEWAERGFCGTCGSTLWYGTVGNGARHLAAGLFDNAGGGEMKIEFFADMCPQGYALEGDHKKMTTSQTEKLFGGST